MFRAMARRRYMVGIAGLCGGFSVGPWLPKLNITRAGRFSLEGHIGAAGGGGVNVAGGIVGSLRAEIDYRVTDRVALSLGLGKMRAVRGNGLDSNIATLGLKIPFSTR